MRTKAGEKEKLKMEILKDSIMTFKKFGQAGAPVDQIMKKAGLTSGALYSHFKGKDDLFLQAAQLDLENLADRYRSLIAEQGSQGLKMIIDDYLSLEHLQRPEMGCLFASLSPDIHRTASKKNKTEISEHYEALMEVIASGFAKGTSDEKKIKAQTLMSMMIGTMSICRILAPEIAKDILLSTRDQAYRMISISV